MTPFVQETEVSNTRLGLLLAEMAGLGGEQLAEAEHLRAEKGGSLGEHLVRRKAISEDRLLEIYGRLYGYAVWPDIPLEYLGNEFSRSVPIQFLKKHKLVPLRVPAGFRQPGGEAHPKTPESESAAADNPAGRSVIAIADPSCMQPLDELIGQIGFESAEVVLAPQEAILTAINLTYELGVGDSTETLVENLGEDEPGIIRAGGGTADLLEDASDAPVIKMVNHIFTQSIKARASDIHLEPYQERFKVRYRVDGILRDFQLLPKSAEASLVSRIKVLAALNIAEKRLPQDGRIELKMGNQAFDVRVSTLPTTYGERVVMRLLSKSKAMFSLPELGINPGGLATLQRLVSSPHGIILVTGPTGSGKTTTLYAVLTSIHKPDINIITIEDPVEYQLNGISQIQVNPKIELTFAKGLRSIVRQDPDVILIGEIRDKETADIAVQSALTGHLVFSTLHTNDSASAVTRLVDIGVEPFLIASSLIAVVAQRLVRVLCPECRIPYAPSETELHSLGIAAAALQGRPFYRAGGCEKCLRTGYIGRVAIFEIMEMNEALKRLVIETYDANRIKSEALAAGMITLRRDGIAKVLEGVTAVEEVLRVTSRETGELL